MARLRSLTLWNVPRRIRLRVISANHRSTRFSLEAPTSFEQRLVKTGGRLVKHAPYYWLLLVEGHLNRTLFGSTVRMIAALPRADGWGTRTDSESSAQK